MPFNLTNGVAQIRIIIPLIILIADNFGRDLHKSQRFQKKWSVHYFPRYRVQALTFVCFVTAGAPSPPLMCTLIWKANWWRAAVKNQIVKQLKLRGEKGQIRTNIEGILKLKIWEIKQNCSRVFCLQERALLLYNCKHKTVNHHFLLHGVHQHLA